MATQYPRKVDKNILQTGKVSFRVRLMSGGHQIDKTLDSLSEAITYRDLVNAGAALDEHAERIYLSRAKKAESKSFTFAAAIKKYSKEKSENKGGWSSEKSRIAKLLRCTHITELPLYQIKPAHILQLLEWLKTSGNLKSPAMQCTESTLKRYLNTIQHIFQIAVDEWHKIEANPCAKIPKSAKPKEAQGRDRRLQGDEYAKMLAALDKQKNGKQAKIIFILAVETAMRRGEQLAMRWEHLDLKNRTLLIPKTKTDTPRTIYLSLAAIEALKSIEPQGIKGKIFSITKMQLTYAFWQARAAIGAPDLRIHDLRHEATSRLFEKGFGDIETATMTGHKTFAMLKKYAHLKQSHILEKLDRAAARGD